MYGMYTGQMRFGNYLDILFDGRNKMYGSYVLRSEYPARLRQAAPANLQQRYFRSSTI